MCITDKYIIIRSEYSSKILIINIDKFILIYDLTVSLRKKNEMVIIVSYVLLINDITLLRLDIKSRNDATLFMILQQLYDDLLLPKGRYLG